jgi:hypothetical protein
MARSMIAPSVRRRQARAVKWVLFTVCIQRTVVRARVWCVLAPRQKTISLAGNL